MGRKMGWIKLRRGHMALLPVGAAYWFSAEAPCCLILQSIEGTRDGRQMGRDLPVQIACARTKPEAARRAVTSWRIATTSPFSIPIFK